jgi:hypothetical protein
VLQDLTQTPVWNLAAFRFLLGGVALANAVLLAREARLWLLDSGVAPSRLAQISIRSRLSPFLALPVNDTTTIAVLSLHVAACTFLTCGFLSNASAIAAWFTLTGLHARNRDILYGGDALLRTLLLLSAAMPVGEALSVDRWMAHGDLGTPSTVNSTSLLVVKVQVALIYLHAFLDKLHNRHWRSGDAVALALRQDGIRRFGVPRFMNTPRCLRVLSYGSLALEGILPPALLLPSTSTGAATAAIVFHMCINIALSVHLFSWIMVPPLTLFLFPGTAGTVQLESESAYLVSSGAAFILVGALWPAIGHTLPPRAQALAHWLWVGQRWNMFCSPSECTVSSTTIVTIWRRGCSTSKSFIWRGPGTQSPFLSSMRHRFLKYESSICTRAHDLALDGLAAHAAGLARWNRGDVDGVQVCSQRRVVNGADQPTRPAPAAYLYRAYSADAAKHILSAMIDDLRRRQDPRALVILSLAAFMLRKAGNPATHTLAIINDLLVDLGLDNSTVCEHARFAASIVVNDSASDVSFPSEIGRFASEILRISASTFNPPSHSSNA